MKRLTVLLGALAVTPRLTADLLARIDAVTRPLAA